MPLSAPSVAASASECLLVLLKGCADPIISTTMATARVSSTYQWVWTTIVCIVLHIIGKYIYELKTDKRGQRQSAVYAIMEFVTHPRCICLHTVVLTWRRNMHQLKNKEQQMTKKAKCESHHEELSTSSRLTSLAFYLRTYSLTSIRHWVFLLLHLPLLLVASMPPFLYVYSRNMPLDSNARRFMYAWFGDPLHYSFMDLILIDYVLSYAAAWLARCCQPHSLCCGYLCCVSFIVLCCVCVVAICAACVLCLCCAVAIYVVSFTVLYLQIQVWWFGCC